MNLYVSHLFYTLIPTYVCNKYFRNWFILQSICFVNSTLMSKVAFRGHIGLPKSLTRTTFLYIYLMWSIFLHTRCECVSSYDDCRFDVRRVCIATPPNTIILQYDLHLQFPPLLINTRFVARNYFTIRVLHIYIYICVCVYVLHVLTLT